MKLTNEIRKQIVDAAIAKSELPKMRERVKKGLPALALAAYKAAVPLPPGIRNLPAGVSQDWLRHESHIQIAAPGYNRWYHAESHHRADPDILPAVIKLDDPVRMPVHFDQIEVQKYPEVAKQAAELLKTHLAANAYEQDLRIKLRAIVFSANTSEQLLRTWPEGKKFLPAEVQKSRALVDTKTVIEVNAVLGLNTGA